MNIYEWIHDDITWCGNECSYLKCERNMQNRLVKDGYFSAALFKNTDVCPLKGEVEHEPLELQIKKQTEEPIEYIPIWSQGKSYCGYCGKRIPKKIKAKYCPKCGQKIKWIKKGDNVE